ncbi:MAG: hypothetical protein GY838_09665, partial [bacterium]|nr:hypothetical protein [bacterium]
MIGQLLEALQGATRKISTMEHRLEQLLRRLYGRSSEKLDPKQMVLFAEMLGQLQADSPAAEPAPEPTPAPAASGERAGHGRRKLPADLPRQRVIHDLDEQDKPCPCCGEMRTVIGEDRSEQIDYVPARIGPVDVMQPRVNDKRTDAEGNRMRFTSAILPPYLRRTKAIDELVPWL